MRIRSLDVTIQVLCVITILILFCACSPGPPSSETIEIIFKFPEDIATITIELISDEYEYKLADKNVADLTQAGFNLWPNYKYKIEVSYKTSGFSDHKRNFYLIIKDNNCILLDAEKISEADIFVFEDKYPVPLGGEYKDSPMLSQEEKRVTIPLYSEK